MAQYINKSALVAEIKRKIEAHKETLKNCDSNISEMVLKGSMSAYLNLLHFLDTLEVKEVDLEKELKTLDDTLFDLDGVAIQGATSYLTVNDVKDIAKHFYELGLSVSNKAVKEVEEEPYIMGETGKFTTTTK